MVLMVKDGKKEFVADVHINSFIKRGYVIDGVAPSPKAPVEEAPVEEAPVEEKPKRTRKPNAE